MKNTHAQNVYEKCAAVINADVLSDFVGNVELGLLDDMQEEEDGRRGDSGGAEEDPEADDGIVHKEVGVLVNKRR